MLMAGAAAIAVAVILLRNREAAQQVGAAVVDAVDGVISGGVIAIGEKVGLQATNTSQCEQDKAAGRTWDASFSCPAKDFINYVFS